MSIQPRHTGTKVQLVKPSERAASNEATYSSVRCVRVNAGFITMLIDWHASHEVY